MKGDRVGIAMRNFPEWSVAFWAAASVGAVVVPLNAWWTGAELEYGLSRLGEHGAGVRCRAAPTGSAAHIAALPSCAT